MKNASCTTNILDIFELELEFVFSAEYFAAALILLTLSTGMSVVALQIYHRGIYGYRVRPWARNLLFHKLATLFCLRGRIEKRLAECEAVFEKVGMGSSSLLSPLR